MTTANATEPKAEPRADAHQRATAQEAGLTKFEPDTLKGIASTAMVTSNGNAFLPSTMAEAMELGKLMCLSNFVPPHLRNKPGDCLAVVLQAGRWGMDPFAVANKTYFVQDRMAYEAQLVNAVLNARAPLDGRLQISWDGEGAALTCKVTGRIKGDPEPHTIWQELGTITTKNSPLWKSSPRQQLAYYTTRMWARLFCPEVLLGVYTEDEARDMGPIEADGSQVIPPARPTRAAVAAAADQTRREGVALNEQFRQTMAPDASGATPAPEPLNESTTLLVAEIKDKIAQVKGNQMLGSIEKDYEGDILDLPEAAQAEIRQAIEARRAELGKK